MTKYSKLFNFKYYEFKFFLNLLVKKKNTIRKINILKFDKLFYIYIEYKYQK